MRIFSSQIGALQTAAARSCSSVKAANTLAHDEDDSASSSVEKARCYLTVARNIHEAVTLWCQASGLPEPQSLVKDREKLEVFARKVAKAESAEILRKGKPAHLGSIDIAVANRFISHAIPDLSDEQKARLRTISASVKAATAADKQGAQDKPAAGKRKKQAAQDALTNSKKAALDFLNSI